MKSPDKVEALVNKDQSTVEFDNSEFKDKALTNSRTKLAEFDYGNQPRDISNLNLEQRDWTTFKNKVNYKGQWIVGTHIKSG